MPHLVPLLIRGINNLSDARYCAGMGAAKITFILDPALPGALDTKAVKELAGWIAGVDLIGEFDRLSAPEINAIAAECGLDAVLLRSFRTADELAEIAPPIYQEIEFPILASIPPRSSGVMAGWTHEATIDEILPALVAGWVIELPTSFSPEVEWFFTTVGRQRALWLGPGLHPDDARKLATELPLAGLVFPSGNEVKPGLRDFDQLEAVFEALEVD